jgi:holin-like protein
MIRKGEALQAKCGRLILQMSALSAIWLLGEGIVSRLHVPIPGSIVGMFLLLAVRLTGTVKRSALSSGAELLMREMLLFFIPAVLVVLNHREFFGWIGLKLLFAILLGTLVVMVSTAFTVDLWWRFARRSDQH